MIIGLHTPDGHLTAGQLAAAAVGIVTGLDTVTKHYGALLLLGIKSRAQGRPGPRRITGDYLRSWAMTVSQEAGGIAVEVGTNAPQGRRLELGFNGKDALGRVYNQPPYPHVGPAADVIEPQYHLAADALVLAVIKSVT